MRPNLTYNMTCNFSMIFKNVHRVEAGARFWEGFSTKNDIKMWFFFGRFDTYYFMFYFRWFLWFLLWSPEICTAPQREPRFSPWLIHAERWSREIFASHDSILELSCRSGVHFKRRSQDAALLDLRWLFINMHGASTGATILSLHQFPMGVSCFISELPLRRRAYFRRGH